MLVASQARRRATRDSGAATQLGPPRGKSLVPRLASTLLAQLDLAIDTLHSASAEDLERAVHDTRKAIKRTRSLLRLLRAELPTAQRKRSNAALREAGRTLAAARDADVALATLDGVLRRGGKRCKRSRGAARLRKRLTAERASARRALHDAGARERALAHLRRARAELEPAVPASSPAPDGSVSCQAAQPGLKRIYRHGRRAMAHAQQQRSVAAMHGWRKRAKDLRYASEALTPSGVPSEDDGPLGQIAAHADKLGETLGEEHDLALLAKRVRAEKRLFKGDRRGRRALLKAIARRRRRLRRKAFKHGNRLYARKPKRFTRQLRESRR